LSIDFRLSQTNTNVIVACSGWWLVVFCDTKKRNKSFVQKSMFNVESNPVSAILGLQPYEKHAI